MTYIESFLRRGFLFVEKLKGTKSINETTVFEDPHLGTLVSHSITGYRVQIFCKKRIYRKRYSRWFIPPTDLVMYDIYSVVSCDAPESLKKACTLEITIPRPRPFFFDESAQRNAAIEWYLDLLIQRVSPSDRL